MAVRKIQIRGFKSIAAVQLELNALNVLIGANGAGKSNFIAVFKLLNELAEKRLALYVARSGGAEALLHMGQKYTSEIYISLDDGERNGYQTSLIADTEGRLFFKDETALFFGNGINNKPFDQPLGTGHRESLLSARPVAQHVLATMKTWRVYHFHDTSDSALVKGPSDISDNSALRADASNLASLLYRMRREFPPVYRRIVLAIKQVAPFFEDFVLRPDPLSPEKIRLEWVEVASDAYRNAYSFSDGTLRYICLATLLLQPVLPNTILIDEPELGLHPAAIVTLAALFRSAAKSTQLIVSTQSVPLINQLRLEDIVVVDRIEDRSIFRRPKYEELKPWLEDYALGDIWEKNILGGRP